MNDSKRAKVPTDDATMIEQLTFLMNVSEYVTLEQKGEGYRASLGGDAWDFLIDDKGPNLVAHGKTVPATVLELLKRVRKIFAQRTKEADRLLTQATARGGA